MFVLTLIRERHQINNAYVFKIPNVKILPDKKKIAELAQISLKLPLKLLGTLFKTYICVLY